MGRYRQATSTIYIDPSHHSNSVEYIDTLLHELAHHAIAFFDEDNDCKSRSHGSQWKAVARYLGAHHMATHNLGEQQKAIVPEYLEQAHKEFLYDESI